MGIVDWAMMGVAAWGMFEAAIGAVIGDWLRPVVGDALRAEMRVAIGAVTSVAIEAVMLGQYCYAAWDQAQQARQISFSCALHSKNMLTAPCTVCKHMCIAIAPCWLQTANTIEWPADGNQLMLSTNMSLM